MSWPDDWCEREYLDWLHGQPCVISNYEMSDMDGPAVDPAHTTTGRYGRGMKPPPWHCLPLRHDLHKKCDAGNQATFWQAAFNEDPWLCMEAVKALSEMKYLRWVQSRGGDVDEAVRGME